MLGVSRAGAQVSPPRRSPGEGKKKGGGARKVKVFFSPMKGFYRAAEVSTTERRRGEKYVSVYSIIHSVSYCRPDTLRMRVSRWFEVSVFPPELTKWMCLPFFFLCVLKSAALNTCVSEMRLIKFDELKKKKCLNALSRLCVVPVRYLPRARRSPQDANSG